MPKSVTTLLVLGGLSTAAWAFPWDTDMADAVFKRAYSWTMATLPEGTISVNHERMPGDRFAEETALLTIPSEADTGEGQRLFNIYCTACHGVDGKGGAPVADNSSGKRYPVPPPPLSGAGNVTQARNDGYLFFTIRDGAAVMPGYGYAMMDHDVWNVVAYMRTMEETTYNAPAPAAEVAE